jgi:hypothetical protein
MAEHLDIRLVIDGVVALILVEAALLVVLRTAFGRGPTVVSSLANCSAGAALVLALRAALDDAPLAAIAACLLAALIAHCVDLATRVGLKARAVERLPELPEDTRRLAV